LSLLVAVASKEQTAVADAIFVIGRADGRRCHSPARALPPSCPPYASPPPLHARRRLAPLPRAAPPSRPSSPLPTVLPPPLHSTRRIHVHFAFAPPHASRPGLTWRPLPFTSSTASRHRCGLSPMSEPPAVEPSPLTKQRQLCFVSWPVTLAVIPARRHLSGPATRRSWSPWRWRAPPRRRRRGLTRRPLCRSTASRARPLHHESTHESPLITTTMPRPCLVAGLSLGLLS
jgi:hypothetical protein